MIHLKKNLKVGVYPVLIVVALLLMGFGDPPPTDVELQNNETFRINLPGSSPTSRGARGSEPTTFNEVLQRLPSRFTCDLNGRDFNASETHCLVCNCVHENGNEPDQGRINVNRVVYTREMVPNYPNTICGVIRQPIQFSWLNRGMRQPYQTLTTANPQVQRCIKTTADAARYRGQWFAPNYHATYVSPSWRRNCRSPQRLGTHIFYTGGCDGVRPPTNFPTQRAGDAVAWTEILFGIPQAFASEDPVSAFIKKNQAYKLKSDFSKDVEKLLGEKTNPALVEGDFNGDGKKDSVAMLIKNKKHIMAFFISSPKGYKMIARDIPDVNSIYLTTLLQKDLPKESASSKARDLVQLEVYMGPTSAYYVEKNKVIEYKGSF